MRDPLIPAAAGTLAGLTTGALLTGNLADVLTLAAFLLAVAVLIGVSYTVGVLVERKAAEKRLDVALALCREGERMRAAAQPSFDEHTWTGAAAAAGPHATTYRGDD